VFVPALSEAYGWSRTTIASATTIGGVATALSAPFVGRAIDRYGGRAIVPLGALVVGVGCIALAGVETAFLFIVVYAAVRMFGQSFVQFPNQITVAKWFERRRGRATAILVGIGATGLIVAPVAVEAIISSRGIGAAWIALGVLALTFGVIPSLLFTARRPEDLGLLPDGAPQPAASIVAPAARDTGAGDWTLGEAVRTPALWLISLSGVLFSLSSTGVGFHQLAYYIELGISSGTAAAVVSAFAFGLTVGGVLWGTLADRVSVRHLIMVQYAAAAGLQLLLLTVSTPAGAFGVSFGLGMLVGGALSLPTLLLAQYYGRGNLGSIAGILQMTRGVSLGSGPLIAAIFYDVTGAYRAAFVSFAVLCVMASAMMAIARRPVRRIAGVSEGT
jgi:MFS family permease